MTLVSRPDLRCGVAGCTAAVVEHRDCNRPAEYRCKTHGPLQPPINPVPVKESRS